MVNLRALIAVPQLVMVGCQGNVDAASNPDAAAPLLEMELVPRPITEGRELLRVCDGDLAAAANDFWAVGPEDLDRTRSAVLQGLRTQLTNKGTAFPVLEEADYYGEAVGFVDDSGERFVYLQAISRRWIAHWKQEYPSNEVARSWLRDCGHGYEQFHAVYRIKTGRLSELRYATKSSCCERADVCEAELLCDCRPMSTMPPNIAIGLANDVSERLCFTPSGWISLGATPSVEQRGGNDGP